MIILKVFFTVLTALMFISLSLLIKIVWEVRDVPRFATLCAVLAHLILIAVLVAIVVIL